MSAEKRLTPKEVNKHLAQYDVKMIRDPHEYYYFVRISQKDEVTWQERIDPFYEYNLEGCTIQIIIDHVLSYRVYR